MSSSPNGWYSRTQPASFTPTADSLIFAVLLNSMVDPEGFKMAVFEPNFVVNAQVHASADQITRCMLIYMLILQGKVLKLAQDDFNAFKQLASRVAQLPKPDSFRNTWVQKTEISCQPISRLIVKTKSMCASVRQI